MVAANHRRAEAQDVGRGDAADHRSTEATRRVDQELDRPPRLLAGGGDRARDRQHHDLQHHGHRRVADAALVEIRERPRQDKQRPDLAQRIGDGLGPPHPEDGGGEPGERGVLGVLAGGARSDGETPRRVGRELLPHAGELRLEPVGQSGLTEPRVGFAGPLDAVAGAGEPEQRAHVVARGQRLAREGVEDLGLEKPCVGDPEAVPREPHEARALATERGGGRIDPVARTPTAFAPRALTLSARELGEGQQPGRVVYTMGRVITSRR